MRSYRTFPPVGPTYFGRLFTDAYVQRRSARAVLPVVRARWQGVHSWPGVEPEDVHCPTLVYTGSSDGNVVEHLQRQRVTIEAVGMCLHVLHNLKHGDLVSALDIVAPLVAPFLKVLGLGLESSLLPLIAFPPVGSNRFCTSG